jgi:hypothetical protein
VLTIHDKFHENYVILAIPPEIDISPVEFKLSERGISYDEMIFIIEIEDDFGSIEFLDRHTIKMKVKGLLPDWIVGLSSNLNRVSYTGVFFFSPRI